MFPAFEFPFRLIVLLPSTFDPGIGLALVRFGGFDSRENLLTLLLVQGKRLDFCDDLFLADRISLFQFDPQHSPRNRRSDSKTVPSARFTFLVYCDAHGAAYNVRGLHRNW